jgi:hypothetical protein
MYKETRGNLQPRSTESGKKDAMQAEKKNRFRKKEESEDEFCTKK